MILFSADKRVSTSPSLLSEGKEETPMALPKEDSAATLLLLQRTATLSGCKRTEAPIVAVLDDVLIFHPFKSNLFAETGLTHEREEWVVPGPEKHTRTVNFIKSTNYLSTRLRFNEQVDLNAIAYYQTGYDKTIEVFRHRFSGDLNLMVKMTSNLRFRTSFNFTCENRPVIPITPYIYTLTNGLQMSF